MLIFFYNKGVLANDICQPGFTQFRSPLHSFGTPPALLQSLTQNQRDRFCAGVGATFYSKESVNLLKYFVNIKKSETPKRSTGSDFHEVGTRSTAKWKFGKLRYLVNTKILQV